MDAFREKNEPLNILLHINKTIASVVLTDVIKILKTNNGLRNE